MGYMSDHAILLSHWDIERLEKAHDAAIRIFGEDKVSPIMGPYINGHVSFFIPPDGSKEGWQESAEGDENRAEFKVWLRSGHVEYVQWIEVQFADDCDKEAIIDSNKRGVENETNR